MSKKRRNAGEEIAEQINKASSKTTTTRITNYRGSVDQTGFTHREQDYDYLDENNNVRTGKTIDVATCSFGHMIQEPKLIMLGECYVCQRLTCSMPGCHFVCAGCGRSFCRKHITLHGSEAYCSRCNWTTYWWRKFWGLD